MGFLDKAKAAASDLATKADTALASSGMGGPGGGAASDPNRLLRDLGVLAYLEATGRQGPEGERDRVLGALREAEGRGALPNLTLQTASAPANVPPPPGAAAAPPPPPGAAGDAAASEGSAPTAPPPVSAPAPADPVPPTSPPPPPPSWASGGSAG